MGICSSCIPVEAVPEEENVTVQKTKPVLETNGMTQITIPAA